MFRDDDAARAAYVTSLERKAARVDELEARIRELEAENRELRARRDSPPPRPPPELIPADEIYVDDKIVGYIDALLAATDPRRTEGILSGALAGTAIELFASAREHARADARRYVTPTDVQQAARVLLPQRIVMKDPDADATSIVRAILDVVDVP